MGCGDRCRLDDHDMTSDCVPNPIRWYPTCRIDIDLHDAPMLGSIHWFPSAQCVLRSTFSGSSRPQHDLCRPRLAGQQLLK